MLDALAPVIVVCRKTSDPTEMMQAAQFAVDGALVEFRDRPNKIGRAPVYAERSIGLDDPGMMAVRRLISLL